MLRRSMLVLAVISMTGCGSEEEAPDTGVVGDVRSNLTWTDGTKLGGVVRIFEGATVEIAPGARITCTPSAQILVGGTLRVKAAARHAVISCARWSGVAVAANGNLDIEGLDLQNADVGYDLTPGAGTANVTDARIENSPRPFRIAKESTLSLTRVTATTPEALGDFDISVSHVSGKLIAKQLDYQANVHEGIMVLRDGEALIEDSTLRAKNGLDLISSYGGKSVTVRYTTMEGAHCGPHMDRSKDADEVPTQGFEFDHVSSTNNQFGITIYATAQTGSFVVKNSNLQSGNAWLDLQGPHGPITFQNVYTEGRELILGTDPPQTLEKAPARIDAAKPR